MGGSERPKGRKVIISYERNLGILRGKKFLLPVLRDDVHYKKGNGGKGRGDEDTGSHCSMQFTEICLLQSKEVVVPKKLEGTYSSVDPGKMTRRSKVRIR